MGLRKRFKKITRAVTKVTKKAVTVIKKNPALAIAAGGLTLGGFAALPVLSKFAGPLLGNIMGGGGGGEQEVAIEGPPPEEQAAATEQQTQMTAALYPGASPAMYQQPYPQQRRQAPRRRGGFWSWLFG